MFFPLPIVIQADVFSRVPDEFRQMAHPVSMHGKVRNSCIEGPSFDLQGNLYCVDIVYGNIYRFDHDGRAELVLRYDGHPNGLKFDSKGMGFIADSMHGLMRFDPKKRTVEPYLTSAFGEPFHGLNDLLFDLQGNLYFTDQGQSGLQRADGRLFKLGADGRLECLLNNVPSPNGLVLNMTEDTLYLAATRGNAVWRVPLHLFEAEAVARVGIFIQMSGGSGPDGLAMSQEGHLVVAHVGMGAVWIFDRKGIPLYKIETDVGNETTNIAFGGSDGKTLYITETESGTVLRAQLPFAGKTMYSHTIRAAAL
jgi:gluconolactonase